MSILKKGLCGDPNLDMLFCTKKELKIFDLGGTRKICPRKGLFLALIWWISSRNVVILSWKFYHSLYIIPPTYPPNFSPFEVSWAEIEFWFGCSKCFSLFLSSWFFWSSGRFFSLQANSIYLICFLFERACRDACHHRALFLN